jgi:photosystem II stability/assembly factor-like uncharacterized protein
MMLKTWCSIAVLITVTGFTNVAQAQAKDGYNVLNLPAIESRLAATSMVYSVSRQGDRFFAVGHRGHILYSDDFADSWTQASVPVRSALLDIHFPTADKGWAVGHSGVILHSEDGGKTWVKQFDGNQLGEQGLAYYEAKAAADPENERLAALVGEMNFALEQGADKPFFKVHFENERSGIAIGAYGIFFRTDDGGDTWVPQMETLDLFQYIHLFDVDRINGEYVFAGEAGNLLLHDAETGDYVPQEYPYEGSIFTELATGGDNLFAAGLQGFAFYSTDGGVSWSASDKPKSGAINDSIQLSDGRMLIVSDEGKMMVSSDGGASFAMVPSDFRGGIGSVIELRGGEVLVSGPYGVRKLALGN